MSKVTIVIPLFDRHEHTNRILGYYNLNKVNFTFILADGSKKKIFNQNYFNKKFPFIKIIYKKFPEDKNYNLYVKKMLNISKKINSKYVYQIANDDFFNPIFIKKAEKFLDRNRNYSFVGGIVRNVRIVQLFKPVNDFGIIKFQKKNQYHNYKNIYRDINHSSLEKRVVLFLSSLPYESVIKRETYHEIWKLIAEFKIMSPHEIDWFFNMIPLVHGKKKFLKIISTIRQSNTYNGMALDVISLNGASKKRFNKYLKFLTNKKIFKSKILLNKLKNTENYKLSIVNENELSMYLTYKKKYFKFYTFFKNCIFGLNYIFTFFIFMFYRNKYTPLYDKISKNFNSKRKLSL